MAEEQGEQIQPSLRNNDRLHMDKYGPKLVDQADKLHDKAHHLNHHHDDQESSQAKGPAGGYDATPIPQAPPGYTIKITFHSARNLPFADVTMTSDPYIHAVLKTDLHKRHKQDPDLTIRTPTIHRNTDPKWNVSWTIAHVPASGFRMKCRLYDEDPRDHDDRLGNVHVDVDKIDDNWKGFKEQDFRVKKRMGSKRAYTLRGCASLLSPNISMDGEVVISVENLGKSEGDNGGQPYTVGPLAWSQHHSPLIGMLAGTKETADGKNGGRKTEKYNFQAIQMQLQGPVPEPLYHRYVEFKSFVKGMFTAHSVRGRILNHALHHQHARIYNFDETTKYGSFDKPSLDVTAKFLEFVRYDQGGRIFTYVITLDGQFRFTETGKEFGIDMLSKHSMHSDVSIYIAFSGEFFVRKLKHPHKSKKSLDPTSETVTPTPEESEKKTAQRDRPDTEKPTSARSPGSPPHSPGSHLSLPSQKNTPKQGPHGFFHWGNSSQRSIQSHVSQTHEAEEPSKDPSHYELIIDNESGTYRPNAKYLPQLRTFLQRNFPGLRVAIMDGQKDEEKLKKLKSEQRERKKKSGDQIMYMQNSSLSSFSSSEEEELERRANPTDLAKSTGGTLKKKYRQAKEKIIGDDFGDDDVRTDQADEQKDLSSAQDVERSVKPSAEETAAESASPITTDRAVPKEDPPKQENVSATPAATVAAAAAGVGGATAALASHSSHQAPEKGREESAAPIVPPPEVEVKSQNAATEIDTQSDRPTPVLNKDNLEQHDQLHSLQFDLHTHQLRSQVTRKPSMSTDADADRMSFNTAFTDAENTEHYVTPKPSLGDGGLRHAVEASNGDHETFESETPKDKRRTDGDVTPTGRQSSAPITVHDVITSNSFIGGGF